MKLPAVLALAVGLLSVTSARAEQTMGLFLNTPDSYLGYTLFAPMLYNESYLIGNDGRLVHSWSTEHVPGNSLYLLEDGRLLRTADPGGNDTFVAGGDAGLIQILDWDSTVLWEFLYSDETVRHHHDVAYLPNGNVLVLAWELKTGAESILAGRDPARLSQGQIWPEHVVEVQPVGAGATIVWEWHMWDHLIQEFDATKDNFGVVADHPELIDINFGNTAADWIHANAIDYNADLDQIVISSPFNDELWIIDHSSTTAEAAGHIGGSAGRGGDVLYRWGNPLAYQAGDVADQMLYGQHDVHWVPPGLAGAGNIMIVNNGNGRPEGAYTTIEELTTTVDVDGGYPLPPAGVAHGPAATSVVFVADPPMDFYAPFISGAQRQPDGNTLICNGPAGTFFEVTPASNEVWRYVSPVSSMGPQCQGETLGPNLVFRTIRYPVGYAGFAGRNLSPGDPIEECLVAVGDVAVAPGVQLMPNVPNPVRSLTSIGFELDRAALVTLAVYNVVGQRVSQLANARYGPGTHHVSWDARTATPGTYFYELRAGDVTERNRMVVVR